jgi:hypothetical protein
VIRVTYIISDINKALAFEWITQNIDSQKIALSFILLNPGESELENYLKEYGFPVRRVICRGKKDWPSALAITFKLLKRWAPDVVHCHLLQANTFSSPAGWYTQKSVYPSSFILAPRILP